MRQVNIYSVQEILLTPFYMGNKSRLSKDLMVSRNKLIKYSLDTDMKSHCVYREGDKWVLRTSLINQGLNDATQ